MNRTTTVLSAYVIPEGTSQYPVPFIETNGIIKLDESDTQVEVGITEKTGDEIKNNIRNFHRKPVHFVPVNSAELSAWLGNKMGVQEGGEHNEQEGAVEDRVLLDKLANDAPIINLVNSICIDGIRAGASDIHIEGGQGGGARIRYRLDGVLRTVRTIENGRFPAISSRIKIMANLNILERRQPQDGRITVSLGDESVDFRVSIVPISGGESIVLRILGRKTSANSLADLGFDEQQLCTLRSLLHIPHGLILMTGPTGSGKTTTLNAMLAEIISDSIKIITIEDPVEFLVEGVNQIQTNEQIGLGFDTLLGRLLRQDPNVIMIGEIRDAGTAEIALRAALTGHLVLSTLHTNDTPSVIPRLINMGVEPYLVASVLRCAAAQRLVRRICPECKAAYTPGTGEAHLLKRFGIGAETVYRGEGCERCGNSGYLGRTVIAELFTTDPGLEVLVMRRENSSVLAAYLQRQGMKTLIQSGLEKAAAGITTIEEVEREAAIPGGDQ